MHPNKVADPVLAKEGADHAPRDYNGGLEKEHPVGSSCWWGVRDEHFSLF